MFRIAKEFAFSASHVLTTLPAEHPCSRLHGHNYTVTLELTSDRLNKHGFVADFRDLAPFKAYLDEELDHQHLNDVFKALTPAVHYEPTSENLAVLLYRAARHLLPLPERVAIAAVRVGETPKTWAEYRP